MATLFIFHLPYSFICPSHHHYSLFHLNRFFSLADLIHCFTFSIIFHWLTSSILLPNSFYMFNMTKTFHRTVETLAFPLPGLWAYNFQLVEEKKQRAMAFPLLMTDGDEMKGWCMAGTVLTQNLCSCSKNTICNSFSWQARDEAFNIFKTYSKRFEIHFSIIYPKTLKERLPSTRKSWTKCRALWLVME